MSAAMYPSVCKEFLEFRSKYGPVDKLATRIFLTGPKVGEEWRLGTAKCFSNSTASSCPSSSETKRPPRSRTSTRKPKKAWKDRSGRRGPAPSSISEWNPATKWKRASHWSSCRPSSFFAYFFSLSLISKGEGRPNCFKLRVQSFMFLAIIFACQPLGIVFLPNHFWKFSVDFRIIRRSHFRQLHKPTRDWGVDNADSRRDFSFLGDRSNFIIHFCYIHVPALLWKQRLQFYFMAISLR